MVHLLLFTLLTSQFASGAEFEKFPSLEPVPGQVCDVSVIEALKVEIARALCMNSLDPVCLTEYASTRIEHPITIDNLANPNFILIGGKKVKANVQYNSVIPDLTSQARMGKFKSHAEQIVKNWTTPNQRFNTRSTAHTTGDRKEMSLEINATDLAAGLLAWIPFLGQVISGAANLIHAIEIKDDPLPAKENVDVSCNLPAIHVSAVKKDQDCVPYYSSNSTAVRQFLRQTPAFQNEALKNPATCSYYNRLLANEHIENSMIERLMSRPVTKFPQCAGDKKVTFGLAIQLRNQSVLSKTQYNFTSSLKTNRHEMPSMSATVEQAQLDPERPAPQELAMGYKMEYTNIGTGIFEEKFRSKTVSAIHPPVRKIRSASAIISAVATACCDLADAAKKDKCLKDHFASQGAEDSSPEAERSKPTKIIK